ncbi:MAG: D-alanyl-D-alanine carboxypeptidase family protein [Leucobacter sp.]
MFATRSRRLFLIVLGGALAVGLALGDTPAVPAAVASPLRSVDQVQDDQAPVDPAQADSAPVDVAQHDPAQSDPESADPAQQDPAPVDPEQADPAQTETAQSETAPAAPTQADEKLQITKPVLKGTAKVGKTLRVQVGRPGSVKPELRYAWFRDGTRIGGASDRTYRLKAKDRGHRVSARVTAVKPGYQSVSRKTGSSNRVALGTLVVTKPKLSGSTRVGGVMQVKASRTGAVKPKLRYAWFRDGKRIGGASGSNYRLKSKDAGHRISARVTATQPGYRKLVKFSKKSAVVRASAIDDPASTQVVVNKLRPLRNKSYYPSGLVYPSGIQNSNGQPVRKEAARALERMVADVRAQGLDFEIISGFRSYDYQSSLYNSYVVRDGRALADTYSARPGHSEHQTGLAVDLGVPGGCGLGTCFGSTSVGKWLASNGAEYGFILRYPSGYTHITGFTYEPWHFRYVGTKTAKDMKKRGIRTLEQYHGLPAAPDYR